MHDTTRGLTFPLAVLLAVACGTSAIIATYARLSHTWDEGLHLAAGMELLQDGRYTYQTENPPLARVVLALIPYMRGTRLPPLGQRGVGPFGATVEMAVDAMFYGTPEYINRVTDGRLGTLLFFWGAIALTWTLAGGRSDPWVATLASASIATLPPFVAHAGLATTDVAFVAAFLLVLLAVRRYLRAPSLWSAALAGVPLGVAVATKFSTLVFLPPAVAGIVALHVWPLHRAHAAALAQPWFWGRLAMAGLIAAATIWAAYGFRTGRVADLPVVLGPFGRMPTSGWPARIRDWRLPAHEFVHGLIYLKAHADRGQGSRLLGQAHPRGVWQYYPVVLATKTPLPFMLFAGAGLASLVRRRKDGEWRWFAGLALGALGVLVVSLASSINLGVRHVLVLYPMIALASAYGLVRRAEQSNRRGAIMAAASAGILLQAALLWLSVPYQITYNNVLAGRDPGWVSGDSNWDWGQGAVALEHYFKERPVPELYILLSGTVRACKMNLPPLKSLPNHPVTGWIAISDSPYRNNGGTIIEDPCGVVDSPGRRWKAPAGWLDWLHAAQPVAILGKTLRIYHVTDLPAGPAPPR